MSEQEFNEQVRAELRRRHNAPDVDTADAETLREYVRRLEEAVFNLAIARNDWRDISAKLNLQIESLVGRKNQAETENAILKVQLAEAKKQASRLADELALERASKGKRK